jgi:uncharacterized membrane-anchored protein YhcB (DUF1043 family)
MTWLYIIGYLIVGFVFTFIVVKFGKDAILVDDDALGIGVMVLVWPIAVVIVLSSALGTVIIRLARRKRE